MTTEQMFTIFPTMMSNYSRTTTANPGLKCSDLNMYTKTFIIQGFEGIPQNLVINIIVFTVLIFIFLILRKSAWNYGRMAYLTKMKNTEQEPLAPNKSASKYDVWTRLFYGDNSLSVDTLTENNGSKGWRKYFPKFLFMDDKSLLLHCGADALLYQTFHRYVLLLTAIMCVICSSIILPINMQGTAYEPHSFAQTTIANLEFKEGQQYLVAHLVMVVVFFIVGFFLMLRFSRYASMQQQPKANNTLMIVGIPLQYCYPTFLSRYFQEAYPTETIESIDFVLDIRELERYRQERMITQQALHFSRSILEKSGERPLMEPYACGICCCYACVQLGCIKQVDAIAYYEEELERCESLYEAEKLHTIQKRVGIAFITFASQKSVANIMKDYKGMCGGMVGASTTVSTYKTMQCAKWNVSPAPIPEDILWLNMSSSAKYWWIRAILINIVIFIIFFFLTTPSYVLNLIQTSNIRAEILDSPIIGQFLPSFVLWAVSVLLPFAVYYSDQLIGHWTKSVEATTTMVKTYICLIFMVLILPSLGLTSIPKLITFLFPEATLTPHNVDDRMVVITNESHWRCIFLPNGGAFFVNYVITASFIGTVVELLRFPELISYTVRIFKSRSAAEKNAVVKTVLSRFDYGTAYAWILLLFSVTTSFSVICPIILPFGLLYQIIKFGVDRYNLYYAYTRSYTDKTTHAIAVTCTLVSLLYPQINLLLYLIYQVGFGILVYISMTALIVSIMAVVLQLVLIWCRSMPSMLDEEEMFPSDRLKVSETSFFGDITIATQISRETDEEDSVSKGVKPCYYPESILDNKDMVQYNAGTDDDEEPS